MTVAHETHRGRILFTPWVTMRILGEHPSLSIAADLSHWACVGETLRLPAKTIAAIAGRTVHIDARVGHAEGPQVADPHTAPAAEAVAAHEACWDVGDITLWMAARRRERYR